MEGFVKDLSSWIYFMMLEIPQWFVNDILWQSRCYKIHETSQRLIDKGICFWPAIKTVFV